MPEYETYSVTATLAPDAGTASLLRIVSTLHGRGARVLEMRFETRDEAGGTVTALVTSGNTGRPTVQASLQRLLDVVDVTTRLERSLGLLSNGN